MITNEYYNITIFITIKFLLPFFSEKKAVKVAILNNIFIINLTIKYY